ncbi:MULTISPECIES: tetratricopeptide repeat protein [unclassified Streptomyces]|uniref:tetratricopeptide repeat protein n=1 Tax=unclassified Streptomyces TaxID=2593676 RepID=UPI003450AB40
MTMSRAVPNLAFRRLRGRHSPAEFAAAVRRAAREIGEQVACDARYIGRVEAGEIRCPNYAYERVFLHMFPGLGLTDLGFSARETVRGRRRADLEGDVPDTAITTRNDEESDVLRRAFMTSGSAALATVSLGIGGPAVAIPAPRGPHRVGETEVRAVEDAVREIRLLDDRYGADGLYRAAAQPLRAAYALLDAGTAARRSTEDRLHAGTGELSLSVGWLAHDSGRHEDARSHYAEALATARVAGNAALEAHAFCNTSFLARDGGRFREALRAAQAGLRAARSVDSARLPALLSLREAGAWAGLGDRSACEQALGRAHGFFDRGPSGGDPEWMSFFGEPEREALESQCWSALGEWGRAARHAHRAVVLQNPHFARNLALYRAHLAKDLAYAGRLEEAATEVRRVTESLAGVASARIRMMLAETRRVLTARRRTRR